ncbi:hypothetical protein E2562_017224 [Oryza meyeriana var. granulata]|uniref:Uncharacterized protein n=1 Tax=Oryza meyeriana var. granulata TaxID=110450 RepID=A0A6G1ELK3_9ORYZ|nr:hypothetical protein E2562_017224 [Oryza meyeriana var. granulata]
MTGTPILRSSSAAVLPPCRSLRELRGHSFQARAPRRPPEFAGWAALELTGGHRSPPKLTASPIPSDRAAPELTSCHKGSAAFDRGQLTVSRL